MSLFNKISLSMCLVLDKRIKEWFRIREEMQSIGFSFIPFICGDGKYLDYEVYNHIDKIEPPPLLSNSTHYPTWYKSPYKAYQAWKCHKRMIEIFLENSNPGEYFFLAEDDIVISEDYFQTLIKVEDFINNNPVDSLYFGHYNRNGTWSTTSNDNIMKLNGSAGWHSLLLKYELCEKLIEFEPRGPFDESFGLVHHKYNVYGIYPSIITQKNNFYSNIEDSILPKPDRYER